MEKIIALAGNPNVGKSTVFNALTGLNQHTGNWPGKTVAGAKGKYTYKQEDYVIVDLPGTYSLISHSKEEEVARDFLCFEKPDCTVVVCDAVCLERNLNLVYQVMEICDNVIVCVNLLDEAKKKKIKIDLEKLSSILNVPVIGTSARSKKGLKELQEAIATSKPKEKLTIEYDEKIKEAIDLIVSKMPPETLVSNRWLALKLLDDDSSVQKAIQEYFKDYYDAPELKSAILKAQEYLKTADFPLEEIKDNIVCTINDLSAKTAKETVFMEKKDYQARDRKIDKILTNKFTGIPIMIILLLFVFWLTITGANYPSEMIYNFLFKIEEYLISFFSFLPNWIVNPLVLGVYRVLAWVISVMLPPMAIFFPLFTILEDLGFLPRIAFNLDRCFKKCCACGKQALTMCMGFGCNAAGVVGCRIIDSPRERLLAILTNNFVPCNGRFPAIISIITMFFIGFSNSLFSSFLSAFFLTIVILLGVFMTMFVSKLLSKTILKGVPSSFTLELPPYRKPQIGKVIVRSIFDRTLFVLGRAISIAAPAGLVIWMMANIMVGGDSVLHHCANFLDPFANILGLDGVILMAFILGFPANEIVIPIMIMGYMALGNITELNDLALLKSVLVDNGWTILTAINFIIFSLFHWPCSTTCLTIKKETGSIKWTLISFLLPTLCGLIMCFITTSLFRILF